MLNSSSALASLYDIICVECTLQTAQYEFNDLSTGTMVSGNLTVPGTSSDFQIDNFFGFQLIAHNVNFFWGTGVYTFDSVGDSVTPGRNISMTVGANQVGMHFLFDWHGNSNIDVLNVFDVSYLNGDMTLTPVDVDNNGIVGFSMVEGPFLGADLATSFVVAAPVPSAVWLFGSGLLCIIGITKRKIKV
ncbi:MAG: hypothetical protein QM504_05060 [Pseudomonadota bacterium]